MRNKAIKVQKGNANIFRVKLYNKDNTPFTLEEIPYVEDIKLYLVKNKDMPSNEAALVIDADEIEDNIVYFPFTAAQSGSLTEGFYYMVVVFYPDNALLRRMLPDSEVPPLVEVYSPAIQF